MASRFIAIAVIAIAMLACAAPEADAAPRRRLARSQARLNNSQARLNNAAARQLRRGFVPAPVFVPVAPRRFLRAPAVFIGF